MPEEETVEQTSDSEQTETVEQKINAAIDAWIVETANTGTDVAMRIASGRAEVLKESIHYILKEN